MVHVEGELGPDPAGVLDQTDPGTVSGHVQRVHNLEHTTRGHNCWQKKKTEPGELGNILKKNLEFPR